MHVAFYVLHILWCVVCRIVYSTLWVACIAVVGLVATAAVLVRCLAHSVVVLNRPTDTLALFGPEQSRRGDMAHHCRRPRMTAVARLSPCAAPVPHSVLHSVPLWHAVDVRHAAAVVRVASGGMRSRHIHRRVHGDHCSHHRSPPHLPKPPTRARPPARNSTGAAAASAVSCSSKGNRRGGAGWGGAGRGAARRGGARLPRALQ